VPSRVVVDGSWNPAPNQAVAIPQASNSIAALRPHFANQWAADIRCMLAFKTENK
jgi:hypothetical protein